MEGMNLFNASVRKCIETQLDRGQKNFIIFPFGDIGMRIKTFLNDAYGIQERLIIDNHLCKYNSRIKPIGILASDKYQNACVILASTNAKIYQQLKKELLSYIKPEQIAELNFERGGVESRKREQRFERKTITGETVSTTIGKYSYGSLLPQDFDPLIESVGSYSSFAPGTTVAANHATEYITTHPMMYAHSPNLEIPVTKKYEEAKHPGHIDGIQPRGYVRKRTRCKIGNDVWLGQNVIICNGANIGNGVIAAAGAIITKDVPDYAFVAGVPARIIRYRFSKEQIAALNRIAWWDWSDDKIRDCYDDFYLPVEEFIKKYDV